MPGAICASVADDVRKQDLDQIVRRHDPKPPFSGRGFETRPSVQGDANALQDFSYLGRETQSQRSRLHAAADGRQQIIAEVLPQAAQGAAHGRLTQVQAICGARDAALLDQRIERDEQIQIQFLEVHELDPRG